MPDSPDWWLLDRFLAGECSRDEAKRVRYWLDKDPTAAAQLEAFRGALGRRAAPVDWDVDRLWSRFAAAAEADTATQYRLPPPLSQVDDAATDAAEVAEAGRVRQPQHMRFNVGRVLRPAMSSWLRVAAAVVLVGSGVGLAVRVWESHAGSNRRPMPHAAAGRVVTTQRAERVDLRLPDGTRVLLAPESKLSVPANYGITSRELTLAGEGYFEVVHDSAKPFLVHAAHGVVHDLGTRFSIRAYPSDSAVQVVVAEGRVVAGLARAASPAGPVLEQGDLARFNAAGAMTITHAVDVDRYQGWVQGQLRFDAVPLRELIQELERWYDIEVELIDAVAEDPTVTIVLKDQPLAQILGAIAALTDTRYEQMGRVVRFRPYQVTPQHRSAS